MINHKLSNVIFDIPDFMEACPEVYVRSDGSLTKAADAVQFDGTVDFLTYFNSCAVCKWKQYAGIEDFYLHLELSGDASVLQFVAYSEGDEAPSPLGAPRAIETGEGAIELLIPATDKQLVGFKLSSNGTSAIRDAWYFSPVEEEQVNPVRLALSTTTFKKEAYIIPNIELVKTEVLGCEDPIASNFHMFVVDNGRSLDVEALSDEGVTVIPNGNVGGAGGFARGMMAALDADDTDAPFTHVLLMDDDVHICTESLKRTFNLLSLACGRYKDAFINGAMLAIEQPNLLFEDVAQVLKSGRYVPINNVVPGLFVDDIAQVAQNISSDVEIENAYGAWWYSCIPMKAVRANGLPLPVFVRCDDVEYGMRCKPTYMTMNGICVWHEGFNGRFRPNVDCYQYVRNFMIMMAMDDCASERMFMTRLERNIHLYLRAMYYNAVELFLDGFEDYLKGPDFIASADGEKLLMANARKNEKLVPIEEIKELEGVDVSKISYDERILDFDVQPRANTLLKLWRSVPYDRHKLPNKFLRNKPQVVPYSRWSTLAPRSVGTETLVALDLDGKTGAVRHMDKERYHELLNRWKALKADNKKRGAQVRQAYKDAKPYLTSYEFWAKYLGL